MLPQSLLRRVGRRSLLAGAAATVLSLGAVSAHAQDTLKLGLVAAMSGQSAKSGEAIVRGLSIAVDEVNAKGGLLGKKVELIVRDDESNPAKGAIAARELVQREKVVALFGGLMILINNPWGESNEKGLKAALEAKKVPYAGIEKFETNDVDVVPQLARLKEAGADVLFLVANVAPSSQVVKSLDRMGWNVPIVSHWGPAGGRFSELAGPSASKVHFIQTYSFSGKLAPKGEAVLAALKKKYPEIKTLADVTPAVGIANAYDALHLTALAIAKAGSVDGPKVREAFYAIDSYDGLIKSFKKPFSPENQDALSEKDYIFTRFVEGEILPLTQ